MKILLAWELGSNWGHLATLLPLALRLREAGHSVLFAVRGLGADLSPLDRAGFAYVASPFAAGPLQKQQSQPVRGYADVLARCGFADAATLGQLVKAWHGLLHLAGPDLVVGKFAPSAAFACYTSGMCPVLSIGTGFELPPLTTPLPLYGDEPAGNDDLQATEAALLGVLQTVARRFGAAPPASFAQAFGPARACLSLPALDHFGPRAGMDYLGPVEDLPPTLALRAVLPAHWQAAGPATGFIYLRVGAAWVNGFIETVAAQFPQRRWVVVDPSLTLEECRALMQRFPNQVAATNQAVDWAGLQAFGLDTVVCHGGHGMVAQALRLNMRLLMLPRHTEQRLLAQRAMDSQPPGTAIAVAPPTVTWPTLGRALQQLFALNTTQYPDGSHGHLTSIDAGDSPDRSQPLAALLQRIEAMQSRPARPPKAVLSLKPAQPMLNQLEVTTRCNFSCFYCAGRDMPQQDMAWDTFTQIVDGIAQPGSTVSLQGEGEPSLHPRFWDMVDHVRARGLVPYTILNGSRIDAERVARLFPRIGISLDTLDPAVAEKIGRHNLPKVLANLEELCRAMGPDRIVVMTVDLGQPLEALRAWARQRGFARHIVQPLMRKEDYAGRYPQALPVGVQQPVEQTVVWHTKASPGPQTCRFLQQDGMRYYTWEGLALPCCFIKDTRGIESIEGLRGMLGRGEVPGGCRGCRELRSLNKI